MPVNFNNRDSEFQDLVSLAREKSRSGNEITSQERQELLQRANQDGQITTDERRFIQSLEHTPNVQILNSADFDPNSFQLVGRWEGEAQGYALDQGGSTPVPGTRADDIGVNRFNRIMMDTSVTASSLEDQLFNTDRVRNNPELYFALSRFTSNLRTNDKEMVMYLDELVNNRRPPLNDNQLRIVVDRLTEMMQTPQYNPTGDFFIETRDLVASALHDISTPSDISQMGLGSCAGTSVQIQLAIRNPSEYLNMLDTLAKGQTYTTRSGNQIPPNFSYTQEGVGGNYISGRTISAKIMQNAIMDYANGATSYNSASSATINSGISDEQVTTLNHQLLGVETTLYSNVQYTPDQLIQILRNSNPTERNPIQISMAYEPGGRDAIHALNVVGIRGNNVTLVNPWGRRETFSMEELQSKILAVHGSAGAGNGINPSDQQVQDLTDAADLPWQTTDGAAHLINDTSTRDTFLNSLNIQQKAQLISELNSGVVSSEDRTAILRIIQHSLRGGPAQDVNSIHGLNHYLTNSHHINFAELMGSLKQDSNLFYNIGEQIIPAMRGNQLMNQQDMADMANVFLDGSTRGNNILYGLDYNTLTQIGIRSDGDQMADHPNVAAKVLVAMLNTYANETGTGNRTVSYQQIRDFINEVDSDLTSDDDVMREVLRQLGYNNGSPAEDSQYSRINSISGMDSTLALIRRIST